MKIQIRWWIAVPALVLAAVCFTSFLRTWNEPPERRIHTETRYVDQHGVKQVKRYSYPPGMPWPETYPPRGPKKTSE